MLSYTIELKGRDPNKPKITRAEAEEMAAQGFRFSIYDPEGEEFRLTIPYQTVREVAVPRMTFMQG